MPLSMVMTLVGDLLQCLCSVSRADGLPGSCIKVFCCFLVVQTLWAEKIQSTADAGSLNTFGRNEIEVAPISSALLRTACLVILYKTCRVPGQELAADGGYPDRYVDSR